MSLSLLLLLLLLLLSLLLLFSYFEVYELTTRILAVRVTRQAQIVCPAPQAQQVRTITMNIVVPEVIAVATTANQQGFAPANTSQAHRTRH